MNYTFLRLIPALCILLISVFLTARYSSNLIAQTMNTVAHVDLTRYAGKWYEIASFPMSFQRGCCGTTATYTPTDKGYSVVENRCFRDSLSGKESTIKGKAFVDDSSSNAKLKVQFFWPFRAKYWIIDLADDYSYAAVSHPNRKYLWILSRSPQMSEEVYLGILKRAAYQGLEVGKLKRTVQ